MLKLPGFYEVDEKGLVQRINIDHQSAGFNSRDILKKVASRGTITIDVAGQKLSPTFDQKLYNSGPLILSQFGGQSSREDDVLRGTTPSVPATVAGSEPNEVQQIVQSLGKSEQLKFLDSLSESHNSGVMQTATYNQMNTLQQFVTTYISEAKRVEIVMTDLIRKKEKEISDFKQRLTRK